MNRVTRCAAGLCVLAAYFSSTSAQAQVLIGPTQFDFVSGIYSARAEFSTDGAGGLVLILRNTSDTLAANDNNAEVLTGLFFDVSGNPPLTKAGSSVTLADRFDPPPATSLMVNDSLNPAGPLADHWGFRNDLTTQAPNDAKYGVGAAAYSSVNIFGNNTAFSGVAGSMQGVDYGLVGIQNEGLNANQGPQTWDSVRFVMPGLNVLGTYAISNVWFQYGSDLNEQSGPPGGGGPPQEIPLGTVPVPAAPVVVLIGSAVFGACLRRRAKETPSVSPS
jgi:hypothetical protein